MAIRRPLNRPALSYLVDTYTGCSVRSDLSAEESGIGRVASEVPITGGWPVRYRSLAGGQEGPGGSVRSKVPSSQKRAE